jgi:hypothetical protein
MVTRLNTLFLSSKWMSAMMLLLIVVSLAFGMGATVSNQFWFGINEYLSCQDIGKPIRYGIGMLGLCHAAMEGAVWGCVFGGGAGAAAGLIAGA